MKKYKVPYCAKCIYLEWIKSKLSLEKMAYVYNISTDYLEELILVGKNSHLKDKKR